MVARRRERLDELAERHDGFEVVVADLTTDAGQRAVAGRISDPATPIDLVVNCAGFGTTGTFHELDPARLAREIELNVGALTRLSHAALASMVPRRRGWLLNVSSVAGFQAAPRLAVYAATKAYVTTLTEGLHEEVRGTGVHVTALCPGLTRTEFQQVSSPDGALERYPAALWMSAEDVARDGTERRDRRQGTVRAGDRLQDDGDRRRPRAAWFRAAPVGPRAAGWWRSPLRSSRSPRTPGASSRGGGRRPTGPCHCASASPGSAFVRHGCRS